MGKKNITVIDDDKELLEEINEVLVLNGYNTAVFSDSNSGLDNVFYTLPDLVLLDIKMNGKSGFEVINELRQNERTSKIPVIAISGYFNGDKLQDLIDEFGFTKCLIKPLNPDIILKEIKKILKQ